MKLIEMADKEYIKCLQLTIYKLWNKDYELSPIEEMSICIEAARGRKYYYELLEKENNNV